MLAARSVCWTFALLAAVLPAEAFGQDHASGDDGRRLRRTPVVEVFQRWRNSVVYVTGPIIEDGKPSIEAFFRTPNQKPVVSLGSGFVIHQAGYIITTAHAIQRVIAHQVTFSNGRSYRAELIGLVPDHDLALLKIEPEHTLQPVRLAKSGDLMIGETVIVISNPHGLMHTCTAGILSAAGRVTRPNGLPGVTLSGLIQTDAGLNPGSSGGPWFNILGEVIGVTTAVKPGSERIGFAVAAAAIRRTLPGMLDVERRYGLQTGLKLHAAEPCTIMAVAAGSPADKARIRSGDVIVRLAGKPITSGADFYLGLIGCKPGQTLRFRVRRNGKLFGGALTPAPRPMPDGAALLKQKFGLTAVPLEQAQARGMALRVDRGVLITAVEAGLYEGHNPKPMPGDVLARIGDFRPRDLNHLGLLLERLQPGHPVQMVLLRLSGNVATRADLIVSPRS